MRAAANVELPLPSRQEWRPAFPPETHQRVQAKGSGVDGGHRGGRSGSPPWRLRGPQQVLQEQQRLKPVSHVDFNAPREDLQQPAGFVLASSTPTSYGPSNLMSGSSASTSRQPKVTTADLQGILDAAGIQPKALVGWSQAWQIGRRLRLCFNVWQAIVRGRRLAGLAAKRYVRQADKAILLSCVCPGTCTLQLAEESKFKRASTGNTHAIGSESATARCSAAPGLLSGGFRRLAAWHLDVY